jgi:hypothetical protein
MARLGPVGVPLVVTPLSPPAEVVDSHSAEPAQAW